MRKRSNLKLRLRRLIAVLTAVTLTLGIGAVFIEIKLRTVARNFAATQVSQILSRAVSRAAMRVLDEYNVTYDEVVHLSRNEQGLVSSIEINTKAINRFKSSLTEAVAEELKNYKSVTFKIPVSAAFGIYYSYLSYPKISYTVSVATTVFTEFKNEFTDAGINQVLHRITVKVGIRGQLALLKEKTGINEATSFTLAETVIVGAVPDAFTNIDYANEDIVDDVFDYGASVPD